MRMPSTPGETGIYDTAFPRRRGARGGWTGIHGLGAFFPEWDAPQYNPDNSDLSQTADIYSIGTQILSVFNTAQIQQINIERAKSGLPPIDSRAIAPRVNVGLTDDLRIPLMIGGAVILFAVLRGR